MRNTDESDEAQNPHRFFIFNKIQTFHKSFENKAALYYRHDQKTNLKEVINMENNSQNFMVEKIRTQYIEKESTELDALRALDAKVKRPANVFAYVFGSISAIIMGSGMSLVMTDIGATVGIADPMIPGIIIGVIGMLMAIVNYPIYNKMLASRRRKYADQIVKLSDKIMKG